MTVSELDPEVADLSFRLSVDQYHGMIESGVLSRDDRVELLDGLLVRNVPETTDHRLTLRLLRDAFAEILPAGWFIDSRAPVTTDTSEPEPDLAAFRGKPRDYARNHPRPGDVAIALEVSSSSLVKDRTLKLAVYARGGVAEYWIVNLKHGTVNVHRGPSGETYSTVHVFRRGDTVPVVLDGTEVGRIDVTSILE